MALPRQSIGDGLGSGFGFDNIGRGMRQRIATLGSGTQDAGVGRMVFNRQLQQTDGCIAEGRIGKWLTFLPQETRLLSRVMVDRFTSHRPYLSRFGHEQV